MGVGGAESVYICARTGTEEDSRAVQIAASRATHSCGLVGRIVFVLEQIKGTNLPS